MTKERRSGLERQFAVTGGCVGMVLKRVAESTSWIFMVLRDESRSNSVGLSRQRGRGGRRE